LASKLSTKASAGGSVRGAEGQLKSARRFSISGTSDRPAETASRMDSHRIEKIPDVTRQISPSENCWAYNWIVSFVELNA
jgi:hypothetical protein